MLLNTAREEIQSNRPLRIHGIIGLVVSILCFVIWFIIDLFTGIYTWWYYPAALFILTFTFHYFMILQKKGLEFHVTFFVVVNTIIFLTWCQSYRDADSTVDMDPWFIIPLFALAIPLALHYALRNRKANKVEHFFDVHFVFYVSVNVLIFQTYLVFNGKGFPFFAFVVFGLGIPLVMHYVRVHHPGNRFLSHLGIFVCVQMIIFMSWMLTSYWPWFVFPLVIWGIFLIMHYRRHMKAHGLLVIAQQGQQPQDNFVYAGRQEQDNLVYAGGQEEEYRVEVNLQEEGPTSDYEHVEQSPTPLYPKV